MNCKCKFVYWHRPRTDCSPHSAWQVNTELVHLDVEELKGIVERNEQGKKTKSLWQAYQIASEQHELDYFKTMLREHEMHLIQEQQRAMEAQAKKEEKKEEKKAKKVKATDDDGDVEMKDGDEAAEKKKPVKKRKKSIAEGEEDGAKVRIELSSLQKSISNSTLENENCSEGLEVQR